MIISERKQIKEIISPGPLSYAVLEHETHRTFLLPGTIFCVLYLEFYHLYFPYLWSINLGIGTDDERYLIVKLPLDYNLIM